MEKVSYRSLTPYEMRLIRNGMLSQACCLVQERFKRQGYEVKMKAIVQAVETARVRG